MNSSQRRTRHHDSQFLFEINRFTALFDPKSKRTQSIRSRRSVGRESGRVSRDPVNAVITPDSSAQTSYLFRRLRRPEEDGDEGEPNDARGVHGEADGLGLVEGLGHPARLDGVHRARDHQQHAVSQKADERQVRYVAL